MQGGGGWRGKPPWLTNPPPPKTYYKNKNKKAIKQDMSLVSWAWHFFIINWCILSQFKLKLKRKKNIIYITLLNLSLHSNPNFSIFLGYPLTMKDKFYGSILQSEALAKVTFISLSLLSLPPSLQKTIPCIFKFFIFHKLIYTSVISSY